MNTIERIFKFIEYIGVSTNEFSKKINVSNGYFAKQRASNANIGSQIIEKIVNNYPELSTDWLITGKGEMLRGAEPVARQPAASKEPATPPPTGSDVMAIYKELLREKDEDIKALNRRIWDFERKDEYVKKLEVENGRLKNDNMVLQDDISDYRRQIVELRELSEFPASIAASPEINYNKIGKKFSPRTP
jgi:hypothetical protein